MTDEKLDELLAKARTHVMTANERREQKISFVYGQLMSNPAITKEEIARRLEEADD